MNVLFLSSGDRVPSARFRILPYLKHFQADGHRVVLANSFPQKYDYFPWMGFRPSQLLKRSVRWWHWLRTRLQRFDVVFIDREIFDNTSTDMETRFRESCGRLVIDLDDAVFLRYPEKFDRLMKLADLVVCGNRFLMDKVRPLNANLCHVPTCVDMDDYAERLREQKNSERPVVGWMGTAGNLKYLSVASAALRQLARERSFELRVVVPSAELLKDTDLQGVDVVHEPWQPQRETEQLRQFDIGLMPLFPNQEWDVYKCGLKLIQYLAVGVPGIAAPVGVNSEILDGNQNGFAAQDTDEWLFALRQLTADPNLRQQMGQRGRQTVIEKYSIQANYPVLRDALQGLLCVERS
ncbi:MAG: glycosyltransferase [Planctomycetaceae bacterium]|nr:glycosyltransferase [Planctomycetaceae bacterium]